MIVYNINFFCGFIISSALYWLLWKIPATSDTWMEVDEDVMGRNNSLVYGVDVSDEERAYSPSTEYPKEE
jgi:NCS1 family nucleobase:cation symporter-1